MTLLSSLINFSSVYLYIFVDSIGFSMYTTMSYSNYKNLISSFQYFSCLTAQLRIPIKC